MSTHVQMNSGQGANIPMSHQILGSRGVNAQCIRSTDDPCCIRDDKANNLHLQICRLFLLSCDIHSLSLFSLDDLLPHRAHSELFKMSFKNVLLFQAVLTCLVAVLIGPGYFLKVLYGLYERPEVTLYPVPCVLGSCLKPSLICLLDPKCRKTLGNYIYVKYQEFHASPLRPNMPDFLAAFYAKICSDPSRYYQ